MNVLFFILTLLSAPIFLFSVIFLGLLLIFLSFLTQDKKIFDFIIWFWTQISLICFRIQITKIKGLRHIPKGPCLYLFNHTSHVDILVLQNIVPRLRFGAKIELFDIPIFGAAMKRVGVLPIARSNLEDVKKVYEQARLRTAHGEQFALAPEGTRQSDPSKLGPFKFGPFIFAIQSRIPVIPVYLKGCYDVMPKETRLPSLNQLFYPVEVEFGEPIIIPEEATPHLYKRILLKQTQEWFESKMNQE